MKEFDVSKLKYNPNNPRKISERQLEKLKKSIADFPEMLKLRPLIINKNNEVLGGNMRLRACRELGLKKIPVLLAEELTEEQQKEFIIKDNVNFGDWDFDLLQEEWSEDDLNEFGLDIEFEDDPDYSVLEDDEKVNEMQRGVKRGIMIEFTNELYPKAYHLYKLHREKGLNIGEFLFEKLSELSNED